jgi:hypothetical protein
MVKSHTAMKTLAMVVDFHNQVLLGQNVIHQQQLVQLIPVYMLYSVAVVGMIAQKLSQSCRSACSGTPSLVPRNPDLFNARKRKKTLCSCLSLACVEKIGVQARQTSILSESRKLLSH